METGVQTIWKAGKVAKGAVAGSKALSGGAAAARALSAGGVAASSAGGYVARGVADAMPAFVKNGAASLANRAASNAIPHPATTGLWGQVQDGLAFAELGNMYAEQISKFDMGVSLKYAQRVGDKFVSAADLAKSYAANASKVLNFSKKLGGVLGVTGIVSSGFELKAVYNNPKSTTGDFAIAGLKLGANVAAVLLRATPAGQVLGVGLAVHELVGWP